MDNLSSHKRPAIRQAIRAAKAKLLYLPPYSPDLNPIEQMFSKLKHLLRKASERTAENTWRRIGSLLDAFSPQERANYFRSEEHTSELQSLMRSSYAVYCLKKNSQTTKNKHTDYSPQENRQLKQTTLLDTTK